MNRANRLITGYGWAGKIGMARAFLANNMARQLP